MEDVRSAFVEMAETFARLLERPEVATLREEPSVVEGYNAVGGVVGHVITAVERLEPLLDKPAPSGLRPTRLGTFYASIKPRHAGRRPEPDPRARS